MSGEAELPHDVPGMPGMRLTAPLPGLPADRIYMPHEGHEEEMRRLALETMHLWPEELRNEYMEHLANKNMGTGGTSCHEWREEHDHSLIREYYDECTRRDIGPGTRRFRCTVSVGEGGAQ